MTVPRFWREQPARYNLIGNKCTKCSSVLFPPRHLCPKCKSGQLEDYKFKGRGKIHTYTVIRVAPPEFESQAPYVIAVIQLDEGPKLTAQIVDCDLNKVKIGQKVKHSFRKIAEEGKAGVIYYGYKFKLAK